MKLTELLEIVGNEPVFTTGLLLAGAGSDSAILCQLTRWVRDGKILRLKRGLFTLAPPFRKVEPHPFLVANRLNVPSYVSLQSALSQYGLIPEAVPMVTSVTTGRTERRASPLGTFLFRHIQPGFFRDYRSVEITAGQQVFLATPEKALLDLVYLTPGGDRAAFLEELRLQEPERLDPERMAMLAEGSGIPKLARAARRIVPFLRRRRP